MNVWARRYDKNGESATADSRKNRIESNEDSIGSGLALHSPTHRLSSFQSSCCTGRVNVLILPRGGFYCRAFALANVLSKCPIKS